MNVVPLTVALKPVILTDRLLKMYRITWLQLTLNTHSHVSQKTYLPSLILADLVHYLVRMEIFIKSIRVKGDVACHVLTLYSYSRKMLAAQNLSLMDSALRTSRPMINLMGSPSSTESVILYFQNLHTVQCALKRVYMEFDSLCTPCMLRHVCIRGQHIVILIIKCISRV